MGGDGRGDGLDEGVEGGNCERSDVASCKGGMTVSSVKQVCYGIRDIPYSRSSLALPFICSAYFSTSSLPRISLTAASACLTAAVATLKTLPHQPPPLAAAGCGDCACASSSLGSATMLWLRVLRVLSVLFLGAAVFVLLNLSSLVLLLGGPELAGVCSALLVPVLDVVVLERRGVPGREVGRAAASALSSAKGSSSSTAAAAGTGAGGAPFVPLAVRVVVDGAAGAGASVEGMSSNCANSSSSVSFFCDMVGSSNDVFVVKYNKVRQVWCVVYLESSKSGVLYLSK